MREIIEKLIEKNGIGASIFQKIDLEITVNPKHLTKLLKILRDNKDTKLNLLTDLFGADFPNKLHRFEIVYNLLSLEHNKRVMVKTHASEDEDIPSATKIYSAACWYEREVFDLFGINFSGNPDMRRILTDYGFMGHPLRKDFPLTGHLQVKYDEEKERVVYEPVNLQQIYRDFDFLSPWEGPKYNLPGDEKAGY